MKDDLTNSRWLIVLALALSGCLPAPITPSQDSSTTGMLGSPTSEKTLAPVSSPTIELTSTSAPTQTPLPTLSNANLQAGHEAFAYLASTGEWISYLLYLPEEFDPARDWPMIVFLHGWVGPIKNFRRILPWTLPEIVAPEQQLPFIVVSPLRATGFWPSYVDRVDELVEFLMDILPVDGTRVYLTGASSGSYGTWNYALKHPERFAAIAPVAAGPSLQQTKPVPENICDLSGIPIWTFHSEGDRGMPVEIARAAVKALEDCGGIIHYTEYSDLGHMETIETAYSDSELYTWFLEHSK